MPGLHQENKKIQNLSICLIKDELRSPDAIVKKDSSIKKHPIEYDGSRIGQLFVQKRYPKPPRWAYFFEDCIDISEIGNIATTSAVLVLEVDDRKTKGSGLHISQFKVFFNKVDFSSQLF